jgi:thymidylate kinase
MSTDQPVIGIVGPCASGKSTLVSELRGRGHKVRHIAQEHSYVKDMWRQISNPDFLIYLDVSFDVSISRSGTTWSEKIFENQIIRLGHARKHADLYIMTDELSPKQVLDEVEKNL